MPFDKMTLSDFSSALASSAPTPGGGGASALVGALGAALASMVCNLTAGKKKYAEYEQDIQRILRNAEHLSTQLLQSIDEDSQCFEPLSAAYGIPKDDPARSEVMENALRLACTAPLHIMELSAQAIELHAELADKGSTLMLSDVGVGLQCCKSALLGASLNIIINVRLMQDVQYAQELRNKTERLIREYGALADEVYAKVLQKLN